MKKMPWGIFTGIFAMCVFFTTIAVVALFIVLNSIAGQTHTTATLCDEWYQTLLFVLDIFFVIALAASATMYVLSRRKGPAIADKAPL